MVSYVILDLMHQGKAFFGLPMQSHTWELDKGLEVVLLMCMYIMQWLPS